MAPRLSLCMLVKDVEHVIGDALRSVKGFVDEVVIVDNASTDRTTSVVYDVFPDALILACTPETHPDWFLVDATETWQQPVPGPFTGKKFLANFAGARQLGWDRATGDFILWFDSDDVVHNAAALPKLLEKIDEQNAHGAYLPYDYSINPDGSTDTTHHRERVVRRSVGFHWHGAIHEALNTAGHPMVVNDDIRIRHANRGRGTPYVPHRNMKVALAKLDREDARSLFYLGQETYLVWPQLAEGFYRKCIQLTGSPEERASAYFAIGRIYESHGMAHVPGSDERAVCMREAATAYRAACESHGENPEHAFAVARTAYFLQDWPTVVRYTELAWRAKTNPFFISRLNERNSSAPYMYMSVALDRLGDYTRMLEICDKGLTIDPNEPHLKHNREIAKARARKRLVLWLGPGWEPWSPDSIDTAGIGGSETAAVHMAKELQKLGIWDVTVVAAAEGVWDGVKYVHTDNFDVHTPVDVFIASRIATPLAFANARVKALWVHDVYPFAEEYLDKADYIFVLSQWHKQFLCERWRQRPDAEKLMAKIVVTRNGIDPERFKNSTPLKRGNKCIYASSADRGLVRLLDIFPLVRQRVPDAQVHVYYGRKLWRDMARDNAALQTHIDQIEERLLQAQREGWLVDHGRVGQTELAQAYLEAKVLAYPTHFTETYCQLPGALVFTKEGMKPIEEIKEGDLVLTHKGRFRKVTKTIKKEYDGEIYSIKRKKDFNPITVTSEHPLYVATFHRRSDAKGMRVYSEDNKKVTWLLPSEIHLDLSYLLSPKMLFGDRREIHLSDYIDMPVQNGMIGPDHRHFEWATVENDVALTEEFAYILGIFAAEGCVSKASGRQGKKQWMSQIIFALHIKEQAIVKKIIKFFGKGTVRQISENGITVATCNSVWANFLDIVIGRRRQKKIPSFIWDASREIQAAFVNGLFDGDGNTSNVVRGNAQTDKPYLQYTTISPSLAYGMAMLLGNLGHFPGITFSRERRAYTLNWTDTLVAVHHRDIEEGYATRVKEIQKRHYKGLVYNFEVEEDASYVTDRTIVHNCISVLEAQAAGCVPVTTRLAALPETVKHGVLVDPPFDDRYRHEWVDAVVDLLLDDALHAAIAAAGRHAALQLSWTAVAAQWADLFQPKAPQIVTKTTPTVSVLVMLSRPGGVDVTMKAMADQSFKDFELVLVDNRYERRRDQIAAEAARFGIRTIHAPEHRRNGKWIVACAAFNTAIALARGKYVIMLHDFTYAPRGWIESHLVHLEGHFKRMTVGHHANVDLPDVVMPTEDNLATDRGVLAPDATFDNFGPAHEISFFKRGYFDASWLPMPIGEKQWQPVFPELYRRGVKPGPGWVTLCNDGFHREFLWEIGGVDERYDFGRGPFDIDISARLHHAGGDVVYVPEPFVSLLNPRFIMRTKPFGEHATAVQGRWSKAELDRYYLLGLQNKRIKAGNPYEMATLAAQLEPWRAPDAERVGQELSDVAYWRRRMRAETP